MNVLYDKNQVVVYNLLTKHIIFKAIYGDATGIITQLIYLPHHH